jgi:diguanylate cyclase (GGDEF)-like protein
VPAKAADTDELTGLMNARGLFAHLQQEVARNARSGDSFAVVLIDLDGLRNANDQFGHLAGNRVLQAVSAGLRRYCRAGDVAARLGGDEFVLVLSDAGKHVGATLGRMEETMGTLAAEADCAAEITFSAGVSRYPDDGLDAETLLEKADERMDEAKSRRKMVPATRECVSPQRDVATAVA